MKYIKLFIILLVPYLIGMFYENKLEKANNNLSDVEHGLFKAKCEIIGLSANLEHYKSIVSDYEKGIPIDTTFDAICKALENHDKYY
jgi:hypothetical protein